jgi:hypothetical protein
VDYSQIGANLKVTLGETFPPQRIFDKNHLVGENVGRRESVTSSD